MRNKYLAVGLGEWRDKQGNEKMENVVAVTKPKKNKIGNVCAYTQLCALCSREYS